MIQIEDILRKNAPLKNLHAGKRCFLVGNGPSLKTQDLTFLKDEIAIVASSFFRHDDAKLINPAYWVLADPFFWQRAEEHLVPALDPVLEMGAAPKLFVPSGAFPFFTNFNRGPLVDLHFFHYDDQRDHTMPIDFSAGIPPYGQNVMIVCLMLAFHLGCNPIYLIGCDHDFYAITEETYESSTITHFYPQQKASLHTEVLTWHQWKQCMDIMDYQYRALREYAAVHGFSVFNATRGGCLETYPRMEYETLFAGQVADPVRDETRDPVRLGQAAMESIDRGDHHSALILLEEAIRANLNRQPKVAGLDYLKALCLTSLGRPREALLWARQDFSCNPDNHGNAAPLIGRLEAFLS